MRFFAYWQSFLETNNLRPMRLANVTDSASFICVAYWTLHSNRAGLSPGPLTRAYSLPTIKSDIDHLNSQCGRRAVYASVIATGGVEWDSLLRAEFAKSVALFAEEYELAGIDINITNCTVRPALWASVFVPLVHQLRIALDPERHIMFTFKYDESLKPLVQGLLPLVNWYHIVTPESLKDTRACMDVCRKHIPASKLVMGVVCPNDSLPVLAEKLAMARGAQLAGVALNNVSRDIPAITHQQLGTWTNACLNGAFFICE